MKYTNILEKLICLGNIVKSNWMDLVFLGFAMLFILLLGFKKISKKKCFLLILISYLTLFGYTIYSYYEPLEAIGNLLLDNLFTNIYFPSTYAYLFALLAIDITTLVALLNSRCDKIYKNIHGTCFFLTNFILTIILEIISKNKIDIFSKTSLFSNTDLVMLLELSINIFIIWLISLIGVYATNVVTERLIAISPKKRKVTEEKLEPVNMEALAVETTFPQENFIPESALESNPSFVNTTIPSSNLENQFIPKPQFIPTYNRATSSETTIPYNQNNNHLYQTNISNPNYNNVTNTFTNWSNANDTSFQNNYPYQPTSNQNQFDLSDFVPKKASSVIPKPVTSMNQETIFEKILKNELPVIHEDTKKVNASSQLDAERNTYTLNDYRIFNKMLKEIKEHNQNNTITIDKNLEYRLITKYSTETYNMFKKMLKNYSN